MQVINKELLSEVLGLEKEAYNIETKGNMIWYSAYDKDYECDLLDIEINIYELAHKCKVWAYEQGFKILDECNAIIITDLLDKEVYIIDDNFKTPYDIKRVFKSCQWILDNK